MSAKTKAETIKRKKKNKKLFGIVQSICASYPSGFSRLFISKWRDKQE